MGSSPLARGAPLLCSFQWVRYGLIPARAGSTADKFSLQLRTGAHPRSRGEHRLVRRWLRCRLGSSPLARGALGWVPAHLPNPGLIPARAGSTLRECPGGSWRRAHPRSRGEHRNFSTLNGRVGGSSPLARGALPVCATLPRVTGLIPARAGSTQIATKNTAILGAHPRSRGEHSSERTIAVTAAGSSPLARGARGERQGGGYRLGLIPARAGSTAQPGHAGEASRAHPRSRGEHSMAHS